MKIRVLRVQVEDIKILICIRTPFAKRVHLVLSVYQAKIVVKVASSGFIKTKKVNHSAMRVDLGTTPIKIQHSFVNRVQKVRIRRPHYRWLKNERNVKIVSRECTAR